jgi:ATP-dependent RNA helicase DOB1
MISDEPNIRDYYNLRQQLDTHTKDMHDVIMHPSHCCQFLQGGRLVKIKYKDYDFGWGAVVAFAARKANKGEVLPPQETYIVDVLLCVASDTKFVPAVNDGLPPGVRPPGPGDQGKMEVVPVVLNCIESIGHLRVFLPNDLKATEQRNNVRKALGEVQKRFPDGIAILDPIENMNIKDDSFKRLLRVSFPLSCCCSVTNAIQKIEVLEARLLSNSLHDSPRLPELYSQYAEKIAMGEKIKSLKKEIASALSVIQLDELKSRKRVLRRLGFIDDADVVQLKARVACEISTGDELVLSELLFNRFFNELTPEQCAACLSCFIFEEKTQEVPALKEELAKPYREIQQQARVIAKMSQESKLTVNEDEYLKSFKYELMEVVFAWSKGASFAQIWYADCRTILSTVTNFIQ